MLEAFLNFFRSTPKPPLQPPQPRIFRISIFDTGESLHETEYGWTSFTFLLLSPGAFFEMMYQEKPTLFVVKTVYVDLVNKVYDYPKDVVQIKVQKVS